MPIAPARAPSRERRASRAISASVAARSRSSIAADAQRRVPDQAGGVDRRGPALERGAIVGEVPRTERCRRVAEQVERRRRAPSRGSGARLTPQLPETTVVTPWLPSASSTGRRAAARSSWVWASMKPGATTWPAASTLLRRARAEVADRPMRSPLRATSARSGPPGAVDDRAVADQQVAARQVGRWHGHRGSRLVGTQRLV